MTPTATIVMGGIGAGKSTFIRTYLGVQYPLAPDELLPPLLTFLARNTGRSADELYKDEQPYLQQITRQSVDALLSILLRQSGSFTLESRAGNGVTMDRIKRSLEAKKHVKLYFLYREPVDAYNKGIFERNRTTPRKISMQMHYQSHREEYHEWHVIEQKYRNHPKVRMYGMQNNGQTFSSVPEKEFQTFIQQAIQKQPYYFLPTPSHA